MPEPVSAVPADAADRAARSDSPAAAGLASRRLAWEVLLAVGGGAYADVALERALQRSSLEGVDRALATELAYGAIRQRLLLDAWLDGLGRVPALRQPPKLRWLLHLGLYQLLFSGRVPASAAVSTTVELAKRGGLARLAPVANGMLRQLLRRRAGLASSAGAGGPGLELEPWSGLELPAGAAASLALRQSLPVWLAELLLQWLPPEQAEAFALAANQPPGLDLRVNPLRCSRDALLEALESAGLAAAVLPGNDDGLALEGRVGDLRRLPGFQQGHWSVQDRTAQQVVALLDPQPGERLLDACAAPGGKCTQMAERIGDRGEVWAIDRSAARLQRLERNAARLGLGCVSSLAADAAELAVVRPDWLGHFDRILVDAPCSGLGTLARHADARWRLQPAAIPELVRLQRALLEGVLPLLRPGGQLVYATCTVHPAENDEQVKALLAAHPGWELLRQWQAWPRPGGGDGFFAALLRAPGG
ncbi:MULTISPECIES: 16S rRNA (cytosine(967)-C(5))-methyltransferase [unclassified Cyanobium]|uniref:16S rRNA (cytosine(967)-C(5))-methyltransferase n=1 Tax=unclassified Cyanobium TaxID=2627006 RepID=UPI001862D6C9|nr:16S rRNA (cytosine(967)-C(5))-methyltransferase [Cyanobium sp. NS01]MBE9152638.1 16S rRNA (cytosine(967)-C(5))-methyltransferase [Cyanobium sp. LEGE 06113]MBE9153157.1 16S rRNA (cytosine(967)-C(5))-methyltransferase [Cyanobium sp. LEGE 06113]QNI71422.1 ribosomal RNA small subunit methyltransferase B [Cyanobium sp. NS01]